MTLGLVALAASFLGAAVLLVMRAPPLSFVVLIVPYAVAGSGIFQALESTCVALVARDQRNLDTGVEPVPPTEPDALHQRARRDYIESTATAALLTLASLLLP